MKRFIAVKAVGNGRYKCRALDSVPLKSEAYPKWLGFNFYDQEYKQWVSPGVRGHIKAQRGTPYWCNVIAYLEESEGAMTEEQIKESYRRSDDTFTEFDLARWKESRASFLAVFGE